MSSLKIVHLEYLLRYLGTLKCIFTSEYFYDFEFDLSSSASSSLLSKDYRIKITG